MNHVVSVSDTNKGLKSSWDSKLTFMVKRIVFILPLVRRRVGLNLGIYRNFLMDF